jgi:hypothetical protein
MSEENKNAKMSEQESTVDDAKNLSEDAQGLGPRHTGPFAFGFVDMIVGEGGVEGPGFVATKNEILQLVRYWTTEIVDLDFSFFLHGATGSSEWRTREFANRRLNAIGKLIGQREVTTAVEQATETFARRVDARAWKVFWEGTKEEQEEFQQYVQERLERDITESPKGQTDG